MIDDKNNGSGGDVLLSMQKHFGPGKAFKHFDGQAGGSIRKRVHGLSTGSNMAPRLQPDEEITHNHAVFGRFYVAVDTFDIYTYDTGFTKKNKAKTGGSPCIHAFSDFAFQKPRFRNRLSAI
jgi:hypothetical protein